ncbi:hypothetical protein ANCDUO_00008 [Ancylostoma duodenale]|uniref:2-oxoglutarate dehydrogenase E1 component/KDG C-terminal domain-containing protein n=1 Tax=Ancylostoma duodenale TaxID=51022 RepID=A0A0C2E2G4_9BILA|nr:hypothetical protein ANCDUO_00008 [Ancylostoma duodenale]
MGSVERRQGIDEENVCEAVFERHLLAEVPSFNGILAASSLSEFAPGTHFRNVIDDNTCKAGKVTKVILTSGKHWIAVEKARDERGLKDTVAIIRLESLCPFPVQDLRDVLKRYPKAKSGWCRDDISKQYQIIRAEPAVF